MRRRRSTHRKQAFGFRRATAVLVTAAVLVAAPSIAQAAFTGKATGAVSASTLNLSTLTAASVTVTCTTGNKNLKIQLTTRVNGANYHQVIVKAYDYALYTGELNAANNWTYQQPNYGYANIPYTYEITAQYNVRVNGNIVNTWTGTALTGARTC